MRARHLIATGCALLTALALGAGVAQADWTTYHGDAQRTGVDAADPATRALSPAWTSPTLAGTTHASPLVYHGLVIVATETDDVYGLDEATGAVRWHVSLGTPVPSSALPCRVDVSSTVGITSTPVIDPASGSLFVVGDLWNGSAAEHDLFRLDPMTGKIDFHRPVDPPSPPSGFNALDQLQRASLNLAGDRVVIGFGGNDGDCGTYWGWLITAPENDAATLGDWKSSLGVWQTAPGDHEGAIWAPGGPSVDGSGNVYVATGNGTSTSTYDYGDSLLKLDPASPSTPLAYFAPSRWLDDNNRDLDLGSMTPALLPGGMVYQGGKDGFGYLLSTSTLGTGSDHSTDLYEQAVCMSFGATAYLNGTLYVPCTSGTKALAIDTVGQRFSVISSWHAPSDANGPPIVAGGLVWVAAWSGSPPKLYGLDPTTGAAVVTQTTPAMEHFTTPAASDGMLFLATKTTVEAYRLSAAPAGGSTPGTTGPSPTGTTTSTSHRTLTCPRRLTVRLPDARHGVVRASIYLGHRRLILRRGRHLRSLTITTPRHTFTLRIIETTRHGRRVVRVLRWRDCRRTR